MLYIFFTMGKLNCPVVDLGSWKDWAFDSRPIAGTQRQSGAVVCRLLNARAFSLWLGI
jgi:hypothetical protein